jgi:hypothetical protein
MELSAPWLSAAAVDPAAFAQVRRQAIFECCKWDPQVEDTSVLSPAPLVLCQGQWELLARLAEELDAEALEAEHELLRRPELHTELGLPRAIRRVLRGAARSPCACGARFVRYDFHFTRQGWLISEANSDVPGGFIEASGFGKLMAGQVKDTAIAGDPARALAAAVRRASDGDRIGLVHATAFTDDRQVMIYLAKHLEREGLDARLVGPDQLRWHDGVARFETAWSKETADLLIRFFPADLESGHKPPHAEQGISAGVG